VSINPGNTAQPPKIDLACVSAGLPNVAQRASRGDSAVGERNRVHAAERRMHCVD
jgi:hypothetical protein